MNPNNRPIGWWECPCCKTTGSGNLYETRRMTVRELLQRIGTDCMRNNLHTNTWVNALFADYNCSCGHSLNKSSKTIIDGDFKVTYTFNPLFEDSTHVEFEDCEEPNWIITDVRFPNEAQAVKDRQGILIRVNRQFTEVTNLEAQLHTSETSLDKYNFDYIIENNGTIEELIEMVRTILIKEKII